VRDFSTLPRRQKPLAVNIACRGSRGPLHLLLDGTGIEVEGEGEWHARKHGGPEPRVWPEIHLGIGEQTLEIREVEIIGSHIGDAPVLADLLSQMAVEEEIGSVTAEGARDTRKCHDAIAHRGAHAIIPPRRNAKPRKTITAGAVAGNEALRAATYLGRALRRRWSGYHRRSRVETKMHHVKLLGQRLMARDFDREVAELPVRITVPNACAAPGIPVTETLGYVCPGIGETRPSADFLQRSRVESPIALQASRGASETARRRGQRPGYRERRAPSHSRRRAAKP
jgi:hypothetical protein